MTVNDVANMNASQGESFEANAAALDHLTETAARNHDEDPQSHLQQPAASQKAVSWLSMLFPRSYLEALEASYHLGNYVIDRKTGEKSFEAMSIYVRLGMHLLYYGSQQEKALHWQRTIDLLKTQSLKMGQQYDLPESKAHIQPFIDSFGLQSTLIELVEPDPTRYSTFNEFFAREIQPHTRPLDDPDDGLVSSSPADCRLTAFPTVDLATKYWIKGFGFSMANLLGGEALASHFDGGSLVIARLAPQDYHRWHSPVSGTVESVKEIPGAYYTVNPQAINEPGTLDVFCENRRSVMTIKTASTGALIAVVAIGAMLVGSIVYVGGVDKPGAAVKRGQCLGKFQYGGSTVIVVYPKGEIVLDEDLVQNSTEHNCETLMKVGWRVGGKGT